MALLMDVSAQSYFEIFSLAESYQIDLVLLRQEYKKLQAQYHPDKFVNADDRSRLQALQIASIINEAYETLNSPLKLAAYLLTLHGVDPEENNQAHLGGDFLLQQMALRDQLEDIVVSTAASAADGNLEQLDQLKAKVETEKQALLTAFTSLYQQGLYAEAKPVYSKLQFLYKLLFEIDIIEEKLLDY